VTGGADARPRVRHPLPPARWPTREEAARARLFSPLALGPLHVHERTWVPAMVPWRATDEGFVTPDVLDWYARFAEGQPGVLVVEATGIRDIPSGPLLRIGDDRFVPGLRELVEVVRERSRGRTRLFIQVIDFLTVRRRPEPATFFDRHLAVTDALRERLTEVRRTPGGDLLDAEVAALQAFVASLRNTRVIYTVQGGGGYFERNQWLLSAEYAQYFTFSTITYHIYHSNVLSMMSYIFVLQCPIFAGIS